MITPVRGVDDNGDELPTIPGDTVGDLVAVNGVSLDAFYLCEYCFGPTLSNLPYGVHYLVYQSGESSLRCIYGGGATFSDSTFHFTNAHAQEISYGDTVDSLQDVDYTVTDISVEDVPVPTGFFYSDLNGYANLAQRREGDFQHAEVIVACVGMLLLAYRHFDESIHGRR